MLVNLEELKKKKNLLAFSGGTDSSALFALLVEANIDFDIAFVNYNIRKESEEEELRTKFLAKKVEFIKKAVRPRPSWRRYKA